MSSSLIYDYEAIYRKVPKRVNSHWKPKYIKKIYRQSKISLKTYISGQNLMTNLVTKISGWHKNIALLQYLTGFSKMDNSRKRHILHKSIHVHVPLFNCTNIILTNEYVYIVHVHHSTKLHVQSTSRHVY